MHPLVQGVTAVTGAPAGAAALGVAGWVLCVLLWAGGAIAGGFALFLAALLSGGVALGWLIGRSIRGKGALRGARAATVLALAVFVPIIFDPHTGDVFNLPKYTLLVLGALVLGGLWVVDTVHHRRLPFWRNGIFWLVLAVLVWDAVSAFAGVDVHVSLLGNYGSYDGLYAALGFFAVVMTAAEAVDVGDLRRLLGALGFAGGVVVVVYGLIQLHDTQLGGSRWDFIAWHTSSFSGDIFSTFGNPNHLGGFLGIVLPIVLVLGIGSTRPFLRAVSSLLCLAILVELLRTGARGAWVAVIVSLIVLVAFLAPEFRRRPVLAFGVAGAVVVVIAGAMALVGRKLLKEPLSQLFQSGGHSPVEQRFQIWTAAAHIAVHHPVTGVGMDNFALIYPRDQSAAWVKALGPSYLVNGAHDLLMNVLADQGFVGLAIFLVLLAFIAIRSIGAWRRCRAIEKAQDSAPDEAARAGRLRLLLAVTSASIVAYLVQALFNVQQIGLTFSFWLLLGLAAVVWRAAGVPDTLRPGVLLRVAAPAPASASLEPGAQGSLGAAEGAERPGRRRTGRAGRTGSPGRGRRRRGSRQEVPWVTLGVAACVTALVVVAAVGADGPYRADHAYWGANEEVTSSQQLNDAYLSAIQHAMVLNPWEPTYPEAAASELVNARTSSTSQESATLDDARTLYRQAFDDERLSGADAAGLANVDLDLARRDKSGARRYLAEAALAALTAVDDDPRDSQYRQLRAQVLAAQRSGS